jgi:hypothetical protein
MVIAFITIFTPAAQIQTLEAAGKVFNISQQWAETLRDRALKTLHNVYRARYFSTRKDAGLTHDKK